MDSCLRRNDGEAMSSLLTKLTTAWRQWQHRKEAKSFRADQLKEDAFDPKQRGKRSVPLAQIVGSVGRYQDFDTTFRLRQHVSSEKFDRVKDLLQGGVPLPPVKLYQIKGDYYVLDGNHRVAAAKALGYEDIEADIIEFLPSAKTLENLLYREKADFMEQTKLPCPLELTEIGQYAYLLKQIQTHQEFLAQAHSAPVSFEQAAADWYETIYQPLLRLIQRGRLLASFPRR
ncbi:hypothetical protein GF348_02650, partial [candidate division KSB3 bacterium]|nr:hypothetical protein [candidate division KSB3 bacterium]